MDYEHPPFIIEKSGQLYVVASSAYCARWERGQTEYVQKSSTECYEIELEEQAPEVDDGVGIIEFWTFTPIAFHKLDEPIPVPWEHVSRKQQIFIGNLLRSKKYTETENGIKTDQEEFEFDVDHLELLTKTQAGKLISLLKKCKSKTPEYPLFTKRKVEGRKRPIWLVDKVPKGKRVRDKVIAAQKNGALRALLLIEPHIIGRKVYWEFEDDASDPLTQPDPYVEAEEYYRYMPDYYLDCKEDHESN